MKTGLTLFFLCLPILLFAQKRTVSGYVVDAQTGETVIGVNVVVEGTQKGAATDGNGYFVIPWLEAKPYTLRFMHIAYEKKLVL